MSLDMTLGDNNGDTISEAVALCFESLGTSRHFCSIAEADLWWLSLHSASLAAVGAGKATFRDSSKLVVIQRFILTLFEEKKYLNTMVILSLMLLLLLYAHVAGMSG